MKPKKKTSTADPTLVLKDRDNRAPAVLLAYQQAWIEDQAQIKVWEKSRRIGASWCEAADDTLLAASQSGMDVFYIAYDKEIAREFIEDCGGWARHYQQAASEIQEEVVRDEDKDILTFNIFFASGHKIQALSSRPRTLRGRQGKIVIDEAAFHDDLDGLLKAAKAHLIWGGRVVILSTHNGEDNPFNGLVSDIREGRENYSLHRVTFDDAVAAGLYRRICLRQGWKWSAAAEAEWSAGIVKQYGAHADEELFCIPSQGSGVFLPRFLIESCMQPGIPILRLALKDTEVDRPEAERKSGTLDWCEVNLKAILAALPRDAKTYLGEDFGRSGDLSVFFLLVEEPGLTYRTAVSVELRNVPFKTQEQILFYLLDQLGRFSGGAFDSRGNGQYLGEAARQRYGAWRIHQVMLSQEWYRENAPPYKAALEDKSLVLPKDADVLEDHRALRMEKGVAKIPENYEGRGRDGGQRHGDSAVAALLGWYAVKNTTAQKIEYWPVGEKRHSSEVRLYL